MNFKSLIKTTEGAVVLGGLALTVLSPILSSTIWAIITGVAYVLVNIPSIITTAKSWVLGK